MKKIFLVIWFLTGFLCFSQNNSAKVQSGSKPDEKTVEWVNIHVPVYPPLARTARIMGTVVIEVQFKGCELDPSSSNVVSGPQLLRAAAMDALKQSTIRCGDFPDSRATIYYDFGFYDDGACDLQHFRLEQKEDHIKILAGPVCVETDQ